MDGNDSLGTKGRLTKDRICAVALETIDEVGLESLSMRTLAGALGVKASSLYYHYDSKGSLLSGVAEFLYRKLARPPDGGEWTDQIKGTFIQLREFIQAHPNAAPLLVSELAASPVAKKRVNVLLKMLSRGGLDLGASAALITNLVALLVGHTYLTVWAQQETGTGQDLETAANGHRAGVDAEADTSPAWLYRLLPAYVSSLDLDAHEVPGDGRCDEPSWVTFDDAAADGWVTESGVPLSYDPERATVYQAGYVAGLDALIRGFASQ